MATTVSIAESLKQKIQEIIDTGSPYRSVSDFVQTWAKIGYMVETGKAELTINGNTIKEINVD